MSISIMLTGQWLPIEAVEKLAELGGYITLQTCRIYGDNIDTRVRRLDDHGGDIMLAGCELADAADNIVEGVSVLRISNGQVSAIEAVRFSDGRYQFSRSSLVGMGLASEDQEQP